MRVIYFRHCSALSPALSLYTNCNWWSGAAQGPRRDSGWEEFQHCPLYSGNQQARVCLDPAKREHEQNCLAGTPPPTDYPSNCAPIRSLFKSCLVSRATVPVVMSGVFYGNTLGPHLSPVIWEKLAWEHVVIAFSRLLGAVETVIVLVK